MFQRDQQIFKVVISNHLTEGRIDIESKKLWWEKHLRNFDPWSLENAGPTLEIELVISSNGNRLRAEAAPGKTSLKSGICFLLTGQDK